MHKTLLPFVQIPQLAKTDLAYATGDVRLRPFFAHEPQLDRFPEIILQRAKVASPRESLAQVLTEQYQGLPQQALVQANIAALRHPQTFTVATAHQPSLFLGPLYFLYKAITTLKLAQAVQTKTPDQHIVPVFVLGSEDHDLEELNSIHLFNKKIAWPSPEKGAVGSMSTASLQPVLAELKTILGESEAAQHLFASVQRAYGEQATLAGATRAMLHELFGAYGLLVLDMNDARLKRHFIPVLKAELLEQPSFKIVHETLTRLQALGFKAQAAPREINLFYLLPGLRERIVLENSGYKILNTELVFSASEILLELENHPERFSPNVVLRPLFQESILPNLAYVGGGGELAYWLERKDLFEHFGLPYPMLVRRNSVLWVDREERKKLAKFNFPAARLFEETEILVRAFVEKNAGDEVELGSEIKDLHQIFDRIAQKALLADPTLEKAVRAEEVKFVGALEQWQSRLLRAEKQKHEVALKQLRSLKEKLFPGNGLQERTDNFMPYLLKHGTAFIETLIATLQPFEAGFVVLEEE